jgi:hypothetical protein
LVLHCFPLLSPAGCWECSDLLAVVACFHSLIFWGSWVICVTNFDVSIAIFGVFGLYSVCVFLQILRNYDATIPIFPEFSL